MCDIISHYKVWGGGVDITLISQYILILQVQITVAPTDTVLTSDNKSFHGSISGPTAFRRLKMTRSDCYLVRYSERQHKHIISVVMRGLGQDKDKDLLKEFEITIEDGTKCAVQGTNKWFKSINELLSYYERMPIHPSMQSLGACCVSPCHHDMEKCDLTNIPHAEAVQKLTSFREKLKRRLTDLQEKQKNAHHQCRIL